MSPEERATAALAKNAANITNWYDVRDDVASAIRSAENDALERAAQRILKSASPSEWVAFKCAAGIVRALAHPSAKEDAR